ncbi:MAG: molecular chaperone TorD family protein [Eggerthellaceae bacterium]|nr:molecular chaperone TorD family protein [Eggerthellaceae bacterium]
MTNNSTENNAIGDYELIELFERRAGSFGFLSRIFRKEVDEDFLNELKGMRFPIDTGNSNVDEGYRLIATYLSNTWENTIDELAADYLRTFLGHGVDGHAAAYPFESVYTSEKRLLMQDARAEILAIYRAAGLDKQDSWKEGEDHIALELEFLQIQSLKTADALKNHDTDEAVRLVRGQYNFMERHINDWVPLFLDEMDKFAQTDFYRGVSKLTRGILAEDWVLIEDILDV